jgi:exosortase
MNGSEKIKAVILAGGDELGRCPIASRLPCSLWAIAGKPVIVRLLEHLISQGIQQISVCAKEDEENLRQVVADFHHTGLNFIGEELPVGTAGCIRDAAGGGDGELLIVLSACTACPPKIDAILNAHRAGGCDLTVLFNPSLRDGKSPGEPADMYVCNRSILEHVPAEGYFDIKESLIPKMLRAGQTVHASVMPEDAGNFRDWQGYMSAVFDNLETIAHTEVNLKPCRHDHSPLILKSASANVEADVRMYGRVVIMDNARISGGTTIIGPAIIGNNVTIGENCVIVNSILWDGASVGSNGKIQRCVVDCHAAVPDNCVFEEKAVPFRPVGMVKSVVAKVLKIAENSANMVKAATQSKFDTVIELLPEWVRPFATDIRKWFLVGLVFVVFLWSYYPGFADLWKLWQASDEYSSGLLVPFLAGYILWSRRHDLAQYNIRPCLWGILGFAAAEAIRFFGLFFMYGSVERLSIVLSVAALVLLLFGWQIFKKLIPVLLFLLLMLPWPNRVQAAISVPLQQWSTSSAVFCLEMIGYAVVREGNIIHIGSATVAVAEACNGLRMITAFITISGLVVLLISRTWWEKLIIFISSFPVALLCNTVRLTITAIAFTVLSGERWETIFHDAGGYAMMPLALGLIVAELWLLTKLTMPPPEEQ